MNKSFSDNSESGSLDFIPINKSPQQRYGQQNFSPQQFSSPNNQRNNWRGRNKRFSHSPSQSPNQHNSSLDSSGGDHSDYNQKHGPRADPYKRNKFNRNSGGKRSETDTSDDISRYCSHEMVCDPWQGLFEKFEQDEANAAKFDTPVEETAAKFDTPVEETAAKLDVSVEDTSNKSESESEANKTIDTEVADISQESSDDLDKS